MLLRLFRFLHGIPCALLGMNEVAWQETRETRHVNDACEHGSGSPGEAGVGVVPAETVAGATPGPS